MEQNSPIELDPSLPHPQLSHLQQFSARPHDELEFSGSHYHIDITEMSTLRGDIERNSPNSSPYGSLHNSPLASGEQLIETDEHSLARTHEQSDLSSLLDYINMPEIPTFEGEIEHNSPLSSHGCSSPDSPLASGEQFIETEQPSTMPHKESDIPKMSIMQGDTEYHSAHSSPYCSLTNSPLAYGEKFIETEQPLTMHHEESDVPEMSTLRGHIEHNSPHSSGYSSPESPLASGEQLSETEQHLVKPLGESDLVNSLDYKDIPEMSTFQGDMAHKSPHSSPGWSSPGSSLASGEQLRDTEQYLARQHEEQDLSSLLDYINIPEISTFEGDIEHNSPHSSHGCSSPNSPLASGEQFIETERPSTMPHEESGEGRGWKDDLRHAISGNKWSNVKAILDQNPDALTAKITSKGETALHVAAVFGHVTIVKELLQLLPPQSLLTRDSNGFTALALSTWQNGNTQVAKCLVNKNSDILVVPDMKNTLPVVHAFLNGYREMGRYLYSVTPPECLTAGHRGPIFLIGCFYAQCFDIALHLLQRYEDLLLKSNSKGVTLAYLIAIMNTALLNPSELVFWKRWIYNYINIPSSTAINHVCVDIPQEDTSQEDKGKLTEPGCGLLKRFITSVDDFIGVKKLQELKLLHAQADELLRLVCKNARKAYQKGVIEEALCRAAKEGNVEFVLQVSKAVPEILLTQTLHLCFIEALDYRQARVFSLIHGLSFKQKLVSSINKGGYILMHKAAIKAPDHVLNRIYAPTLQMQRELQWFKEVESLTPPGLRGFRNKEGMTAVELFRQSHKEFMKQGEEWIKATASSCSVVGALIVTIMFAAAFTVPGGNDQNLGYPLFIKQPFFKVFIFSTIISLLSSSTSVLMFLAILTSQFSEEKFLKSLPTKLILGLSFLFISIVTMMVAFLSTIRLMLKHTNYSWGLLPIMILASVPIFLFVLSQFPLLLHTYVSTYGNIFDRKVKPWP